MKVRQKDVECLICLRFLSMLKKKTISNTYKVWWCSYLYRQRYSVCIMETLILIKKFRLRYLWWRPKMTYAVYDKFSPGWKTIDHGFWNYDTAITVIDNRQIPAQTIVQSAFKLLDLDNDHKQYLPLWYGVVYLTQRRWPNYDTNLVQKNLQKRGFPSLAENDGPWH